MSGKRCKAINGKVHFPCDFCGKYSDEVLCLIKGPEVGICDECVEMCAEIVEEKKKQKYIEFFRET